MLARLNRQSNAAGSAGSRKISRVEPPPFFHGTVRYAAARTMIIRGLSHFTGGSARLVSISLRVSSNGTRGQCMSCAAHARQYVWSCSVIGTLLVVQADARADDLPPGWSGKGQAGYVMSRGNSVTDAANVKVDVNLVRQDWKYALELDGLLGRNSGITSAERWDARLQSDYQITAHLFSFGALAYQDDRFSGFQYQLSGSGGLGYRFFDSDTTKLSAQLGVGYRALRPEI